MSFIKQFFSLFEKTKGRNKLSKKKLHLVLDLDHTLLHSISVSKLSQKERYLIKEADSRRFDKSNPEYLMIKLRPFLHEFLKEANKLFTMHVYTMGSYVYAKNVLSLIDPDKIYFGDRVITKEKSPPNKKTLDLISADQRRVVIVDNTSSVWPQHKPNLLEIAKYIYFRDGMMKSKEESYAEKKIDESRSDGALSNVLKILQKAHTRFQELESDDLRLLIRDP
ncbi:unnamed protein product [Eruca vesicaria subsp. sativa]|uniref:RNA polymerase II C-terminal domain phosphatase-like n=1 Tax=Eruca vesicaria subsp. sativa TaxID=29727 RepID=A0ABC8K4U3_ERUVS|nr:unnamed protein product [Eruca vesicaria subsp. sativa]